MAATEVTVVGSLQKPIRSAIAPASRSISAIKPLQLERPYKSRAHMQPAVSQASRGDNMAGKDDNDGGLWRKEYEDSDHAGSRGSVSSLLRAVQEGGSNAVMQQVSSIRHFFMPELPYAIITEIKKRVPLSFRGEEEEEEEEEMEHVMGPRCTWPRSKLGVGTAESRLQEDHEQLGYIPGPRCAWPRNGAQALGSVGIGSMSAMNASVEEMDRVLRYSSSAQEHENKENGSYCKTLQASDTDVVEGPRCAWPRSMTPRRMLATGVGLGLINYLLIGQGGAPALAIVLQSPLPISTTTWEEKYGSSSAISLMRKVSCLN